MNDPHAEVRMTMAQMAGLLISERTEPAVVQLYNKVAMAIIHRSLSTANRDLQLSIITTVYNIACVPNDKVLNFTIRAFVLFLGHPSVMNHSVAQIYLKNIAAVRNKTVKDIFFRFQDEVFKVISELLIHNQLFNPKCVSATLLNLTQGLSFQTTKDFLDTSGPKYLLKYLLPLIIKKPKTTEILSVVAAMAGTELSSLLKDSFQYVYPHVNLFEDKKTLESVCKLIEQYTEYSLISLIRISFKVITCELLLYFHQEKRKVTEALLELRRIESDTPVEVIKPDGYPNTDSEVAQFIQPRFLGVLAYMDSILVSRSGCESGKRHALLTLPELIRLMGKVHITPVRFKVLATLRSALKLYGDSFPELVCFAWRAFVLNVSTLGPLLSTIVVSLLPLLDQHSVEISSVFHICIVDNLEAVSGYLAELYFLPDTPPIHQIYTLVQKELAKLRNLPVKDQLAVTLRMATHENADVRLLGLHKLRTELSLHRQHMVCLIRDHDNMDPFILKLLDALISGCKDPNEGVQLASAQCLGEIGAVDPGLLPNRVKMEVEEKEISFVINSEAFVIRALKEFVRAFQAATTTMDSYAFGIQELLKLYNVTKSDIWKQLSDSTKEIISPFRDSRYKPMQVKDTNIPHPIFGSTHGTGFKMWAVHWVSRLIPAVTDEFVRKVFSVCQLGLKNDLQTLLFFLPYIVLYAILGATKSQSVRIAEEMSTVLTWSDDQPATEGDTPLGSILTTGSSVQDLPVSQEKSLTHTLCAKTIYQLFDFLYRWLRETKQKIKPNEKSALSLQYDTLHEFLKKFSKLEISEGSFKCREYTRALLFLEEYITENPNTLQSYLPSLGIIYYHLHDPDSLRGIIAIHETEPTAQEMILFHEVTGKLQDAAACYEQLGQENVGGEDLYKAMVQCYLGMDQPLTALKLAQGLLNSGQCVNLVDLQAEAMLSLSQFPQLEQLLAGQDEGLGWGASLGQALLHLSQRRRDLMVATLNTMRQSLVRSLAGCSVSNSGYRHSYDVIVKLHIITELEKLGDMVLNMLDCQSVEQSSAVFARVVREELDNRLSVVQPACRVLQPVLCVRRVVLSLAQQMFTNTQPCRGIMPLFNTEISNSWLKSIEIARKSGHFQQAYTNILTVEPYKPKGLFVEKAKLLWAKCEPEAALNTLQWGIEHHFPDATEFKTLPASERLDDRKLFAEAKLLMAVYNDENVNIDMETNVNNYRSAMEVCRNWEKSVVCFAQYKYKYLRTFSDNSEFLTKTLEYQVDIIYYFGKSLEYGCEYIYQSMPRMLSIWLDFGTQLAQDCISIPNRNTANLAERRATMDKMTTLIETFIERLPTYMFMTAFSQLISRICHPLKDCYKILRRVIIKIIIAYPQQALWMFLSVYKSPYTVRVKKCEDVLRSSEIQQEGALCQVISDFRDLFDKLIELGNKSNPEKGAAISIKSFLGSLYRLVSSPSFSKVVIPLQKFRTISLPRSTSSYHNPFPEDMVYKSGMKEEVVVLASLQKPKKLTFIGTDGKQLSYDVQAK
ncbi:serine/threonine-protein kinase ATR-like [Homalodisca vitripennis]|uniref:serine/threonine-protein kinase ATR-like n=1 Tax=Homalodisca vitripennis TaxID=197043 RepID=UPI001EEB06B2|nr:serine/threonine-protein kinase ATR-like [Homalodisca vitripennis]XP_046670129.1 serine/threonine-protein kinase ATR-like [Homalodisca vitripennis]